MTEYRDRIVDLLWASITLKLQFAHESLLFNVRLAVIVNGGRAPRRDGSLVASHKCAEVRIHGTICGAGIWDWTVLRSDGGEIRCVKRLLERSDNDLTSILPPHYHADKLADIEDQLINMQSTAGKHPAVWWLRSSLFWFTMGLLGVFIGMEADFNLSERFF